MGRYKIADLENLSGVKAHTIRIWEQRYNLLEPIRSETNIRYYDDQQLKKLLNVVSLVKSGNKISSICKLDDSDINKRLESLYRVGGAGIKEEMLINQLISSGLTYDEQMFEKAFSNGILSFGLVGSYERVLYPMLTKVGFLWATSELNPSQEHFISNLIKQKMFAAIDTLTPPTNSDEKWLLFLPEDEFHELGLLVANYTIRSNHKKVYYLGPDVPVENLIDVSKKISPTHFVTFSVNKNRLENTQEVLSTLKENIGDPKTFVCCEQSLSSQLKLSGNQKCICSFEEFKEII